MGLAIDWVTDASVVDRLAELFCTNVDPDYVSHGELMEGRAAEPGRWVPDLRERMLGEFRELVAATERTLARRVGGAVFVARVDEEIVGLGIVALHGGADGVRYAELGDIVVGRAGRARGTGAWSGGRSSSCDGSGFRACSSRAGGTMTGRTASSNRSASGSARSS